KARRVRILGGLLRFSAFYNLAMLFFQTNALEAAATHTAGPSRKRPRSVSTGLTCVFCMIFWPRSWCSAVIRRVRRHGIKRSLLMRKGYYDQAESRREALP